MGVRVRLREVSSYERCPLTGGVRLREVRNVEFSREIARTTVWCLLMEGVHLGEVTVSRGSTVVPKECVLIYMYNHLHCKYF